MLFRPQPISQVPAGPSSRYADAVLLSILAKVAAGATLGGVAGAIITGDWIFTIIWAVALPVFIMIGLFSGLRGRRAPGTLGFSLARVETVQRAGANVDGTQLVDVRLTVVGDITYTTTTRASLNDNELRGTVVPGAITAVELIGANRPDARIVTAPAPEVEAQLATARLDPSLIPVASSVPAWETATTTTPGTPKPGTKQSGSRVASRVLSFAIILVVGAAVLIPAYQSIARGVNNIATGNWDGSDMVTGIYQQESVDQMIAAAGTTQFTTVNFYPTYILGDAVSRTSPNNTDAITWRYGRAWVDGPSFIQDDDLSSELFDIGDLDFSIIGSVVNEAIALARISDYESVYAFVRNDAESNAAEISVSIRGPYDDAYFAFGFDGELVSQSGSVFDE